MKWHKYLHAFDLKQLGQESPFITSTEVIEHTKDRQIFHFTFEDGAVLKFVNELPILGQITSVQPRPYFQVIKPPENNPDHLRVDEIYAPDLRKNNDD